VTERVISRDIFGRLQQATAGAPAVLSELCRDYVAEARNTISQLRAALAKGDAAQVRERAHYLKGSSLMIGARELSQHCATLEQMGRDSDLRTADAEVERVIAALQAVETELAEQVGPSALPSEGSAA
jgi:HPt (histidine-containing phosphotransfer) domain-containing protein